jgi:hypothetical protein
MKKSLGFGLAVIFSLLFLPLMALAVELKDTTITYTDYREMAVGEPGVIYKIRIENTGRTTKTYELFPDTTAIKAVGTYRIDPTTKVTLRPGEETVLTFYLSVENNVYERVSIPLEVKSGNEATNLELAMRPSGPFEEHGDGWLNNAIKIAFYMLVALIFIALIITILRRSRKKEDEGNNEEPEVETYY